MSRGREPGARSDGPLRLARWVLIATLLVPVAVVPGFFFPYVTLRAVYFRVLVEVAVALLLWLVLRRETVLNIRRDVVLWALLAWVGANVLAAVFGVAPMRSLFGDHERMGGVWFWVHLLAFYIALRAFFREEDWWRFFRISVAVATLIALYGLVQYQFRIFNFGIGGIDAGVTVGNSGLLGVYLLANVALSGLLVVRAKGLARPLYVTVGLVLVAGLVFSGNRSSTLGLILGSGLAVVAYGFWAKSGRSRWVLPAVAVFAVAAALPFVAGARWASPITSRLPAVDRLSRGVDSSRVVQWRATVDGIRNRPLLGFGPENYSIVWSRFYHPEMYRFLEDSRWDRAHNAYLDAFATTGVFGFLALLAICMALAWATIRSARSARNRMGADKGAIIEAIALGFFAAYAFYLFFWFFDLNSTMLWIALAAFVSTRSGAPLVSLGSPRERRWQTNLVLAAGGVVFVAVLYVHGWETLRMARTLDAVRQPGRPPERILQDYESVFGSPAPVTQHVFAMYADHLASFRPRFQEIRSDAPSAALFDRAFILAIEEFERQAGRDPFNERITVQHARTLMMGAYYYGSARLYESALKRLQQAVNLAPRRIPVRLALGMAYLNVQRPTEALDEFTKAYALYPPLGQTQAYLGLAHAELKENKEAVRWLTGALNAGYMPDRRTVTNVVRALADEGDAIHGAQLAKLYIHRKYGPTFMWSNAPAPVDPGDTELAKLTAEMFLRGGDLVAARTLEAAWDTLCEPVTPLDMIGDAARGKPSDPAAACPQPWRVR